MLSPRSKKCWQFHFWFLCFSKYSLNIWKFMVHVLLKPGLENLCWQEYTEKPYKRDLHDPDNHDGVITHLEPGILECEVKWVLGSITTNKASRGDGILVELFQILKDDAVKVLYSIFQHIWKTQQWLQDWKRSVFIPIPKKGNAKECSNYCTIALISHTSKVMLKILQARLQQYVNFQMFKLDLERQRNQRSKCQHLLDHRKSKRVPEKHLFLLY